ncbi:hypothetical protein SprV_0501787600 [Sparganum proliferum]
MVGSSATINYTNVIVAAEDVKGSKHPSSEALERDPGPIGPVVRATKVSHHSNNPIEVAGRYIISELRTNLKLSGLVVELVLGCVRLDFSSASVRFSVFGFANIISSSSYEQQFHPPSSP